MRLVLRTHIAEYFPTTEFAYGAYVSYASTRPFPARRDAVFF